MFKAPLKSRFKSIKHSPTATFQTERCTSVFQFQQYLISMSCWMIVCQILCIYLAIDCYNGQFLNFLTFVVQNIVLKIMNINK